MSNIIELHSLDNRSIVRIDKGELVSYMVATTEIMHQKGAPGWGSTEIEMFPTIGATKENDFSVTTPNGVAKLDQHGILRVMEYLPKTIEKSSASFYKKYTANTSLPNPKFPNRSTQEFVSWPYDFEFIKTFELTTEGLKISFEIISEKNMPFMLGFHPAFKIYKEDFVLKTSDQAISLQNVLDAGAPAFLIEDCKEITLSDNGILKINIKTTGFNHIMLWTEVTNMICIEPITFYPPSVSANKLHEGFQHSSGYEKLEVCIAPEIV
ncbi:hypothetical protein [Aquimarina longa]|uniref:aldose epimerase family protein n=1 Tax=Aquimarina longa TaxID=1080221 RepID=UPI0007827663|nr:hypothetical protein [Aquimarina longa]